MLNVKYIIQTNEKGEELPSQNPDANGNAWFVNNLKLVNNPDDEIKSLTKLDSKKTAIINKAESPELTKKINFVTDTLATIKLLKYKANHLTYSSKNKNAGLAIFSEIYYKNGWNAYINDKLVPHFRANYVLRALEIPAGNNKIEFKFEPQVVKTGSIVALFSFIGMLALIFGGIYLEYKNRKV